MPVSLTHPPGTDTARPGIFNYAGNIVSVSDLRVLFGIEEAQHESAGRLIITQTGDKYTAFRVDEILSVSQAPDTGWGELPAQLPRGIFTRTLLVDKHIHLYAEFQKLQGLKQTGYLKAYIAGLDKACTEAKTANTDTPEIPKLSDSRHQSTIRGAQSRAHLLAKSDTHKTASETPAYTSLITNKQSAAQSVTRRRKATAPHTGRAVLTHRSKQLSGHVQTRKIQPENSAKKRSIEVAMQQAESAPAHTSPVSAYLRPEQGPASHPQAELATNSGGVWLVAVLAIMLTSGLTYWLLYPMELFQQTRLASHENQVDAMAMSELIAQEDIESWIDPQQASELIVQTNAQELAANKPAEIAEPESDSGQISAVGDSNKNLQATIQVQDSVLQEKRQNITIEMAQQESAIEPVFGVVATSDVSETNNVSNREPEIDGYVPELAPVADVDVTQAAENSQATDAHMLDSNIAAEEMVEVETSTHAIVQEENPLVVPLEEQANAEQSLQSVVVPDIALIQQAENAIAPGRQKTIAAGEAQVPVQQADETALLADARQGEQQQTDDTSTSTQQQTDARDIVPPPIQQALVDEPGMTVQALDVQIKDSDSVTTAEAQTNVPMQVAGQQIPSVLSPVGMQPSALLRKQQKPDSSEMHSPQIPSKKSAMPDDKQSDQQNNEASQIQSTTGVVVQATPQGDGATQPNEGAILHGSSGKDAVVQGADRSSSVNESVAERQEHGISAKQSLSLEQKQQQSDSNAAESGASAGFEYKADINKDESGVTIILNTPDDEVAIFDQGTADSNPVEVHAMRAEDVSADVDQSALVKSEAGSEVEVVQSLKTKKERVHIVIKGDTLWHIAKRYVNNPFRYPELARLSNIKNADLIYPGDRVRIIHAPAN